MKIVAHTDTDCQRFLEACEQEAKLATCMRSKCGSVIVKNGEIIGRGSNTPPHDDEGQRRCQNKKTSYDVKVTDKTCCMHAEQRAIMDALTHHPEQLAGARLYFVRLDNQTQEMKQSGEPYCTICSKMALDVGIAEFVLWREKGFYVYDTKEYNDLSYNFISK